MTQITWIWQKVGEDLRLLLIDEKREEFMCFCRLFFPVIVFLLFCHYVLTHKQDYSCVCLSAEDPVFSPWGPARTVHLNIGGPVASPLGHSVQKSLVSTWLYYKAYKRTLDFPFWTVHPSVHCHSMMQPVAPFLSRALIAFDPFQSLWGSHLLPQWKSSSRKPDRSMSPHTACSVWFLKLGLLI